MGSIQLRVWNTLGILWELYRKNQMDCRFKRDFLIVRSKGNVMYKGIYGLSLILPFWPKFLRVGEGGEEGPICLSTLDPNGQSGPLSGRQKWHFNAYYRIKFKLILIMKMMISVMKIVILLMIMVMKMTKKLTNTMVFQSKKRNMFSRKGVGWDWGGGDKSARNL